MLEKSVTVFIVQETGQPDRTFDNIELATAAFKEPNKGAEKLLAQLLVIAKKVQVITEMEAK
jgi:hypothetical protein